MSESLKELPAAHYLTAEQKIRSRSLYEKVFSEDTERFVDYYYTYKIRDNKILALEEEGQIISMLHLNPYRMIVNGFEVKSNYIVAVATDEDYRHCGHMRRLLEKALRDMSQEKMPFTFLMPVRESIYAPFDFVWICPYTAVPMRVAQMDMEAQNRYLASRYQMFCKRDERYMENLEAEKLAEAGEQPPAGMPPYMVRITDVEQMLSLTAGQQSREVYLRVTDAVIEKNNGCFLWRISENGSTAEKLTKVPEKVDLALSVGELASMIFEDFRIFLSEVV